MLDPTSPHTPSASGYTAQNPPENPDGPQDSGVAQAERTTRYVQTSASEQAATSGKDIAERRFGHANAQRDSSHRYRTKELLEWANTSNHPDTLKALKKCRVSASADYAEPGQKSLERLSRQEQLNLLKQHLAKKQPEARKAGSEACHAFNPVHKTFATPVQFDLTINKQTQVLTQGQQSKLANSVILDEISDQLKGIAKKGHHSKWAGDLGRSNITLQIEIQEKDSGDCYLLPIHSVNSNRQSVQKTVGKKGTDDKKSVEAKEEELRAKLQLSIPGSDPILKDVLRQDVLNPVYVFVTNEFGVTPSSQTYSIDVTAINRDEFIVENKAEYTTYTKPAEMKSYGGKTTLYAKSHFKRENGVFVPTGLSIDINLDNIKPKHLPDEPKMKRAQSAEALNRNRVRPTTSFDLSPPVMRRQISQQHNAPVKLDITTVGSQLYATNMAAPELEHLINEKTAIKSYKKSLTDDQEQWENLPAASSMSTPCPVKQTTAQLSKLNTLAPTSDFFKESKSSLSASDASTRRAMEQAEAAYKKRWQEKATELVKASSDSMHNTAINSFSSVTLQGEKFEQYMKLYGILNHMNNEMVRLAGKTKAAKCSFSRQELTQEQLLSKLLKIKLKSSKHLKKLRGSGCEFSSLCEHYGFYKDQKPTKGHETAAQYLEQKKTQVLLEEKKVGASVMLATFAGENTEYKSKSPDSYNDFAKFINQLAAYDKDGKATPLISYMLDNPEQFRDFRLFDDNGFKPVAELEQEVPKLAQAVSTKVIKKLDTLSHKELSSDDLKAIQTLFGLKPEEVSSSLGASGFAFNIFEQIKSLISSEPFVYAAKVDELISFFENKTSGTSYV